MGFKTLCYVIQEEGVALLFPSQLAPLLSSHLIALDVCSVWITIFFVAALFLFEIGSSALYLIYVILAFLFLLGRIILEQSKGEKWVYLQALRLATVLHLFLWGIMPLIFSALIYSFHTPVQWFLSSLCSIFIAFFSLSLFLLPFYLLLWVSLLYSTFFLSPPPFPPLSWFIPILVLNSFLVFFLLFSLSPLLQQLRDKTRVIYIYFHPPPGGRSFEGAERDLDRIEESV